jgi:hypothetical protein
MYLPEIENYLGAHPAAREIAEADRRVTGVTGIMGIGGIGGGRAYAGRRPCVPASTGGRRSRS